MKKIIKVVSNDESIRMFFIRNESITTIETSNPMTQIR